MPSPIATGPNEIGTYNYHHWAEPPARMVKVILIRQLRASGKYQSVADLGSTVARPVCAAREAVRFRRG